MDVNITRNSVTEVFARVISSSGLPLLPKTVQSYTHRIMTLKNQQHTEKPISNRHMTDESQINEFLIALEVPGKDGHPLIKVHPHCLAPWYELHDALPVLSLGHDEVFFSRKMRGFFCHDTISGFAWFLHDNPTQAAKQWSIRNEECNAWREVDVYTGEVLPPEPSEERRRENEVIHEAVKEAMRAIR